MKGVSLGKGVPPSARVRSTKGASSLPPFSFTSGFSPKFPFPSLSNASCEMLCIHVTHLVIMQFTTQSFLALPTFVQQNMSVTQKNEITHTPFHSTSVSQRTFLHLIILLSTQSFIVVDMILSVLHICRKRDALKNIERSRYVTLP